MRRLWHANQPQGSIDCAVTMHLRLHAHTNDFMTWFVLLMVPICPFGAFLTMLLSAKLRRTLAQSHICKRCRLQNKALANNDFWTLLAIANLGVCKTYPSDTVVDWPRTDIVTLLVCQLQAPRAAVDKCATYCYCMLVGYFAICVRGFYRVSISRTLGTRFSSISCDCKSALLQTLCPLLPQYNCCVAALLANDG